MVTFYTFPGGGPFSRLYGQTVPCGKQSPAQHTPCTVCPSLNVVQGTPQSPQLFGSVW